MSLFTVARLIGVSLLAAIAVESSIQMLQIRHQDALTNDVCALFSLPLETGQIREAYEGLENALKLRGENSACVSVVDNGRSFSPDCFEASEKYRTVQCKAQGNTGIRASVSFATKSLLGKDLLELWLSIALALFLVFFLIQWTLSYLVLVFSNEVSALISQEGPSNTRPKAHKLANLMLNRLGIAEGVRTKIDLLRAQLKGYEEQIIRESSARTKAQCEAEASKVFIEKVKSIHHDIRSPLSSLQSVLEKVSAIDGDACRALATAVRRIQNLANDLNNFELNAERPELVIAEVVIEEIRTLMENKFSDLKSASLTVRYDSATLSPIMVGEKSFFSAVENLIENAFEAISTGGVVEITLETVGEFCQITVGDNGPGIPIGASEVLFGKGYSFAKIGGTGLGLYTCKSNVEAWGGTIECLSSPQGTRFVVLLPRVQSGVTFSGLPAVTELKVIDDDPLIASVLASSGFTISDSASTALDGNRILADDSGDGSSILVDYHLGADQLGTDLIADHPRRKDVYLCTNAFKDPEVIRRARTIGVRIIPKPLCFTEYARRIAYQRSKAAL